MWGGGTFMASQGHSNQFIKARGRWSSDTYLKYIQDNGKFRELTNKLTKRKPGQEIKPTYDGALPNISIYKKVKASSCTVNRGAMTEIKLGTKDRHSYLDNPFYERPFMKLKATNTPHIQTATKTTSTTQGQHVQDQTTSVDLAMDQEDGETIKLITPSRNTKIRHLNKQTMTYDILVIKYNQATNTYTDLVKVGTQSNQNPSEDLHPGDLHEFTDTIVIDKDLVQITTCENYHTLTLQVPIKLVIGSHTMFTPSNLELPNQFNKPGPQLCEQAVMVMTNNPAPHSELMFKAFDRLNRERQEPH